MSWAPIEAAPTEATVGARGPIIIGLDAEGEVARTFYVPRHPKGEGWLRSGGGYLEQWHPVLWIALPEGVA